MSVGNEQLGKMATRGKRERVVDLVIYFQSRRLVLNCEKWAKENVAVRQLPICIIK